MAELDVAMTAEMTPTAALIRTILQAKYEATEGAFRRESHAMGDLLGLTSVSSDCTSPSSLVRQDGASCHDVLIGTICRRNHDRPPYHISSNKPQNLVSWAPFLSSCSSVSCNRQMAHRASQRLAQEERP